jgi:hypothetical protein
MKKGVPLVSTKSAAMLRYLEGNYYLTTRTHRPQNKISVAAAFSCSKIFVVFAFFAVKG